MILAVSQTNIQAFIVALEALKAISTSPQDTKVELAQQAQKAFVELVEQTSNTAEQLLKDIEAKQQHLVQVNRDNTNLEQQMREVGSKVGALQEKISRCTSQLSSLSNSILSAESEESNVRRQIREERDTQGTAIFSAIPGINIIVAVCTQRPERLIPGVGTLQGMHSVFTDRIGELEKRVSRLRSEKSSLRSEQSTVATQLNEIKNQKANLQGKAEQLQSEAKQIDQDIKNLGKAVTVIQQLRSETLTLSNKYLFLGVSCDQLGKIVQLNQPQIEENSLSNLLRESKQIQEQYMRSIA